MKLKEMKGLPERAGLARLTWVNGDGKSELIDPRLPSRKKDKIYLPAENPNCKFFRLQRGQQFLFQITSEMFPHEIWFGGTDEMPFLVQLENEAFEIFKRKGQKGFYEALKPEVIRVIERKFNVSSKRQGDIWAVRLPSFSWDDVSFNLLLCLGEVREPYFAKSIPIFGTRHRLAGLYHDIVEDLLLEDNLSNYIPMFAEGTIESPDHSPMELKGIHVLAQTRYLFNPDRAD